MRNTPNNIINIIIINNLFIYVNILYHSTSNFSINWTTDSGKKNPKICLPNQIVLYYYYTRIFGSHSPSIGMESDSKHGTTNIRWSKKHLIWSMMMMFPRIFINKMEFIGTPYHRIYICVYDRYFTCILYMLECMKYIMFAFFIYRYSTNLFCCPFSLPSLCLSSISSVENILIFIYKWIIISFYMKHAW